MSRRVEAAAKNVAFGYLGSLATSLLGFMLRQVFILHLGCVLNGVNALYTGILTVLSMAELGIGTAISYSLYKPVAQGNIEKIKAYMHLYKRAYVLIGCVVCVIGLLISPFLPYLVRGADLDRRDLTLYFYIFLFNTVSTYFVAYKFSLVNAEQKNYIQTNILTVSKIITSLIQVIVIVTTQNFYLYLLSAAAVELAQKIFASVYLNRRYPYLKGLIFFSTNERDPKLSREETQSVVAKTKALVLTKVGDAARLQSDSMIISAFVNVTAAGYVSNYNMVLNFALGFMNVAFNSVISGFGNLIATEDKEKQYLLFRVYRFFSAWVYGFTAVVFFIILTPFVQLWLGDATILPQVVVYLMLADYFFKGDRVVLFNFKTAAGVFEPDKYLPFVQGIISLAIALSLVHSLGLVGVFLAMLISGLVANFVRPRIIYRVCFGRGVMPYYLDWLKYLAVVGVSLALGLIGGRFIMATVSIASVALAALAATVVFHAVFLSVFCRSEEFRYLYEIAKKRLIRKEK